MRWSEPDGCGLRGNSLRWGLRIGTREAHAHLEARVPGFHTCESYKQYLEGTWLFRKPIEVALARISKSGNRVPWTGLPIASAARQDLIDLGGEVSPTFQAYAMSNDIADVMGAYYVLEGSSLGARILLSRALGLGCRNGFGARHLELQTSSPGRWPRFIEQLEHGQGLEIARCVRAANRVFEFALSAMETVQRATAVKG